MLRRLFWALSFAFAALAGFAVVRALLLVGEPFPGFLLSANATVAAFGSDDWPGVRAGLGVWDRIVAVGEEPVTSAEDVLAIVRSKPEGTAFRYTVRRGETTSIVTVPSRRYALRDFVREPLPWIVTGVFVAAAGLSLFAARPAWTTFGFAAFGVALGTALLRIDLLVPQSGAAAFQGTLPLVAAALIHLALVFPRRPAVVQRYPALLAVPYAVSIGLGIARGVALVRSPEAWIALDRAAFAYCGVASVIVLAAFLHAAARASDAVDRDRARVVLIGLLPAVSGMIVAALVRVATGRPGVLAIAGLVGVWGWVGSLAYAAASRDLFDLEAAVRRTLAYSIQWAATVVLYAAALAIAAALLRAGGYPPPTLLPVLGLVVAIPFVPGVFAAIHRRVEGRLFPLRARLTEVVEELSEDLAALQERSAVSSLVEGVIAERLGARATVQLIGNDASPGNADAGADPALIAALAAGAPVSAYDRGIGAAAGWLERHGFCLALPLLAHRRLFGALLIGELPGGRMFNREDIDVLSILASRIAISLSNAEAYERLRDLEGRLRDENRALREELDLHRDLPGIVGQSRAMQAVFRSIELVAGLDTTVLVLGETGTGKELVARGIHARSRRRDGPFVVVSCGAIPASLVESELFGHERGAFTGAAARRYGKFELARGGTVFLDEVAELPPEAQGKLLRIIQEREFERVGGTETLTADVRVIAATNRDLESEVRALRFRQDLFFRLNVFPLRLPPLRARREDLPLLVDALLKRWSTRLGKRVLGLTPASSVAVERYSWPGNVRELENVIERAIVTGEGELVVLPPLRAPLPEPPSEADASTRPLAEVVRAAKIAAIDRALASGGNQARAAELLGLKAPSLSRMLRDLGLRR